jgi:hypothetical protein
MIEAVVTVALRAVLASVVLGGALALVVLVATRALALTAATRHALWTTALLAIAVIPLTGLGFSMMRATVAPARLDVPSAHAMRNAAGAHGTALPPAHSPAAPATNGVSRAAGFRLHLTPALALGVLVVWALGALIGMIGLVASVRRVRGLKHRSSPLDVALSDELPWLTEVGPAARPTCASPTRSRRRSRSASAAPSS